MNALRFEDYPLWANLALFAATAAVTWLAGTRLSHTADAIAGATGIGQAAVGLMLLAGVTSLPEVAVTVTGALRGNASLAVNSLLGSIALQVAVLAIADVILTRRAITALVADPIVLLQIAMNTLLLALFVGAVAAGDRLAFGVGLWSTALLLGWAASVWLIARSEGRLSWVVARTQHRDELVQTRRRRRDRGGDTSGDRAKPGLGMLAAQAAGAAVLILAAGYLVTRSGEAIAGQTGLGDSFGGFALLALSTALPEASTVVESIRIGRPLMAISDIFGTNLADIALVFVADLAYPGGPVLDEVGRFSMFAAALGAALSLFYLIGLIERRDRTIARMGLDSLAVLLAYAGGLVVLFLLRR